MSYIKSTLNQAKFYMANGKAEKAAELLESMNDKAVVNEIINRSHKVMKPVLSELVNNTFTGDMLTEKVFYEKDSLIQGILEVVVDKDLELQREIPVLDSEGNPIVKNGKELKTKIVAKLPESIMYKGKLYKLIGADDEKIYFWPVGVEVPRRLNYWFSSKNMADKAGFNVVLKAKGCRRDITGCGLKSAKDLTNKHGRSVDLGVIIVAKSVMDEFKRLYGFDCEFSQVRIMFDNGKYAKGTLASDEATNMKPGFYGSIKGGNIVGDAEAVEMVILASYYRQPWGTTANSQQFTYAGVPFPQRYGDSTRIMKEYAKLKFGEPAVVQNLQQMLINDAARSLSKINLSEGYASQVAVRDISSNANMIIFTDRQDWHNRRENMTLLFSPYLPVHKNFYRVNVQFIFKPEWSGMIGLNTNKDNFKFIIKYWNKFWGRDCDGDGVVLTTDPIVHIYSIHFADAQWIDTLQWKGEKPEDSGNVLDAIQEAFTNIISQHQMVGIFDLFARRILQHKDLSWNERTRFARAIQGAITSVKKIVDLRDLDNLNWVFQIAGNKEYLKKNQVDAKKDIQLQMKKLNQAIDSIKFYNEDNRKPGDPDLNQLKNTLASAYEEVSYSHYYLQGDNHYQPFKEVIERALALNYDKNQVGRIRKLGEKLLLGMDEATVSKCAGLVEEIKRVWMVKDEELGYTDKLAIIKSLVDDYKQAVGQLPVLGTIMAKLSAKTVVSIMDFNDIVAIDKALGTGFYATYVLPVKNAPKLKILSKNQLNTLVSDPNILSSLEDGEYEVMDTKSVGYYNWMNKTGNCNSSTTLLKLRMVKA